MRVSFAEAMCDPGQYLPLAQTAEEVGFHGFVIPDSLAYPEKSDSKYPYTPDGNREFLKDAPFIDPFCLATLLAASTKRIHFNTFVIKLPIRHPVLVAKQAMSVAVLSNNRFGLGVGLSPWPEDYAICGVPWEKRGARMNEMMTIIKNLTAGGFYGFEGEHFQIPSIKLSPAPTEPIPLLVGGHSEAALLRAVKLSDGWMHAGGDEQALVGMIARLKELCREHRPEGAPFQIHVASVYGFTPDGLRRLEDMGVTDAIVGFRLPYQKDTVPLQTKLDLIRSYGDNVIAKFFR